MKGFAPIFILFIVFCSSLANDTIQLQEVYSGSQKANQTRSIDFSVTEQSTNEAQLYVTAETPYNNPLQMPRMLIKSADGLYNLTCYDDRSDYTEICAIANKQLTKDRKFTIEISCIVDCSYQISAYMNKVVSLNLNDRVLVSAMNDFGLANALRIQVPDEADFTQIVLTANIVNIEEVTEGLQFKINYGLPNQTQVPTEQKYQKSGQSTWDQGLSIVLSKQEIFPGDIIQILIFVPAKMKVKFGSYLVDGNQYIIELNKVVRDYISYKEDRVYILDLQSVKDKIQQDDIDVTFTVFSGTPALKVSFDPTFPDEKIMSNHYVEGKVNAVLTPQIRKEFGFNSTVYIKVESFWSSAFTLSVSLNKADFIPLQLQMTEISRLAGQNIDNFIYEESITVQKGADDTKTTMNYVAKVEMIKGAALFGVRRCESLEKKNNMECILHSANQVTNDQSVKNSFNDIDAEMQESYNTFEIRYSYNFKKCTQFDLTDTLVKYTCVFQLVGLVDQSSNVSSIQYALTLYQRKFSSLLKEGQIIKDTVDKENYHFYAFMLPETDKVSEVNFFFTTIQGDIVSLESQQVRYPTIFQLGGQKPITLALDGSMSFKGSNVQSKYFLSVYGYQKSDYTITVSVLRNNENATTPQENKTKVLTQIALRESIVQSYTMPKSQTQMLFSFTARKNAEVQILVAAFQGSITFQIMKLVVNTDGTKKIEKASCKSVGAQSCNLVTGDSQQKYLVKISGKEDEAEVFTISYRYSSNDQCIEYPMNTPMSVSLKAGKSLCTKYTIKQPKQLQVVIQLSTIELLQGDISARLIVNPSEQNKEIIQILDHSKKIPKQQIEQLCIKSQKGETFKICTIQIVFQTKQDVSFKSIIEETTRQSILFDGVSQKVVTEDLTNKKGKHFYYNIYTKNTLRLFFTTQAQGTYKVIAKLANQSDYNIKSESLFAEFDTKQSEFVYAKQFSSPMHMTQFARNLDDETCKNCVILISVFRTDYSDQGNHKLSAFTIEITQTQSQLAVGQTKLGFVGQGEIYNYDVSTQGLQGGIFFIQYLSAEECGQLLILNEQQHSIDEFKSYALLQQPNKDYRVIIQGKKSCKYQVSFADQAKPVAEIIEQVPYQYTLTKGKQQYLLYHHNLNQSFRLIQAIETGDVKVRITPIALQSLNSSNPNNQNSLPTLEDVITSRLFEDYKYGGDGRLNQVQVKTTDQFFCFNCYYVVGISAVTNSKLKIGITPLDQPIPLLQSSVFKDKIQPDSPARKYKYYSINQFNVSFNIMLGKINVVIQGPNSSLLYNQTISGNKQFSVQNLQIQQNYIFDPYDSNTQFIITVTPVGQVCQYSIDLKLQNVILKLKEGFPYYMYLQPGEQETLKFINLYDSKQKITILLQVSEDSFVDNNLMALTIKKQKNGVQSSIQRNQFSVSRSQNSFMIVIFESEVTNYLISLKNTESVPISYSMLLVKDSLNHLKANENLLYTNEITYEIYPSKDQSIMIQAFECIGRISIRASENFNKIKQGDAEVSLQHADQAGHYVVSADKQVGNQMFIRVQNKNASQNLLYRIGYSYYPLAENAKTRNPYKIIYIDSHQIRYQETEDNITFLMEAVKIGKQNPGGIKIQRIFYTVVIGNQQGQVRQYVSCNIRSENAKIGTGNKLIDRDFESNNPSITINKTTIIQQFGSLEGNFYVGAKAQVKIKYAQSKEYYQTNLQYIYDIVQLSEKTTIPGQPPGTLALEIIVVIAIAFLASTVILLLALRYCWRRFKQNYFHTDLIEEDVVGPSEDVLQKTGSGGVSYPQQK